MSSITYPHIGKKKLLLIAGPCVIEDESSPNDIAEGILEQIEGLDVEFVFKASYRKANRSSLNSFTGIGDEKALYVINDIKQTFNIPVTTDIHAHNEAAWAAEVVDILQIPAFLCRQTALLLAAAETGKIINVKKGQFLSPEAMRFAVEKIRSINDQVMLTERGTSFGYQDLVVDVRAIPKMQMNKTPVIMDCTHALQRPNQSKGVTGGEPEMIATIAKAAVAVGADGLFIECHPDPSSAKSDGANMLELSKLRALITEVLKIRKALEE